MPLLSSPLALLLLLPLLLPLLPLLLLLLSSPSSPSSPSPPPPSSLLRITIATDSGALHHLPSRFWPLFRDTTILTYLRHVHVPRSERAPTYVSYSPILSLSLTHTCVAYRQCSGDVHATEIPHDAAT